MLTVKSLILDYPSSVRFKDALKMMTGHTKEWQLWSDAKLEDPMSTKPSPIQTGPKYDKYFFIDQTDCRELCESDKHEIFDIGMAIRAYRQLLGSATEEQKRVLYVEFLHAYNDDFREHPQGEILEGFVLMMIRNTREELLKLNEVDDILKGELLRELRRFDESVEWLEKVKQTQPEMSWLIDQIIEQAKNHNRKVFQIRIENLT